jgi:hypothetical protein
MADFAEMSAFRFETVTPRRLDLADESALEFRELLSWFLSCACLSMAFDSLHPNKPP